MDAKTGEEIWRTKPGDNKWREWRRWGGFLALLGLLTSGVAALLIMAQWSANLFFHPCQ